MNPPGYSPDFNRDETIRGWAREEATGNLCLGSKTKVQERVGSFLAGPASRKEQVKHHCRTVLQTKAEALVRDSRPASPHPANAHPTLALVWKSPQESPTPQSRPLITREKIKKNYYSVENPSFLSFFHSLFILF